jgi:hypothetical protein
MAGRSALARASNESAAKEAAVLVGMAGCGNDVLRDRLNAHDDCHQSVLATPYPVLGGNAVM